MGDATARVPPTAPGDGARNDVGVKSLAVIIDPTRRRHLVFRASNHAGEQFNRSLGGTVEYAERTVDAAVREIREELDATFVPESLLGVVENIFELDGVIGHEIVFLYVGSLAESDAVPDGGRPFDAGGGPGWAEWRSITDPPVGVALYPDQLQDLLTDWLGDEV